MSASSAFHCIRERGGWNSSSFHVLLDRLKSFWNGKAQCFIVNQMNFSVLSIFSDIKKEFNSTKVGVHFWASQQ